MLESNHNAKNLESVMCKSTLSVDWQGNLFDCDSPSASPSCSSHRMDPQPCAALGAHRKCCCDHRMDMLPADRAFVARRRAQSPLSCQRIRPSRGRAGSIPSSGHRKGADPRDPKIELGRVLPDLARASARINSTVRERFEGGGGVDLALAPRAYEVTVPFPKELVPLCTVGLYAIDEECFISFA